LVSESAQGLFPGYFAFVMATGIVGVSMLMLGVPHLPHVFFCIAVAGQTWLLLLTAIRALKHPQKMLADFLVFTRSPGYFTAIAAFGVLGSFAIRLVHNYDIGMACWIAGIVIWVVLFYGFALCMITAREKPPVENSVNGSWLVLVVATQSLSILSALVSTRGSEALLYLAACLFMIGSALYLLLVSILTSRLLFRVVEPVALTPLYWIMMGAAAISTLAGAELNRHVERWGAVEIQALPLVHGFTMFFWVIATSWIPLLILLGVWRHVVRRQSFRYEPQQWSVVFPLGMYSVATHTFASEFGLEFLSPLPYVFLILAALAWFAALVGMAHNALVAWKSA